MQRALGLRSPREPRPPVTLQGITPVGEPMAMVAVDGSYAFLWSTSDIWVALVRVATITYRVRDGGFHKADLRFVDRAITVTTNAELLEQQDDLLRSLHAATEGSKEQHRDMVNEFRRMVEAQAALELARSREPLLLALDGSLASLPRQVDYLGAVVEACRSAGHILVGVSKDSMTHAFRRALTDEEFLRELRGMGYVRVPPEFEGRQKALLHGDVYFARLHPEAQKWFRVDVGNPRGDPGTAFGHLVPYATSPLCPGYPYPLLEAHRAAVTVRQFREQFEDLVLKEVLAGGVPLEDALRGMVDMDGKRLGAFHEYLDRVARELK